MVLRGLVVVPLTGVTAVSSGAAWLDGHALSVDSDTIKCVLQAVETEDQHHHLQPLEALT